MNTPRNMRRHALLALVAIVASLVVPTGTVLGAVGAGPSKYYRTIEQTSQPDWMSWVPNNTSLGNMSLPGTHDTLSIHGGDSTQTQEDFGSNGETLGQQLLSGIRALDIRVRVADVDKKVFTIHHGAVYQQAVYGDVLREMGEFLTAHPTETIVMRVKAECKGTNCKDADGTTDTVRREIFNHYRDNNEWAKKTFWMPSFTGEADMPTLGQVRGKVVLMIFHDTSSDEDTETKGIYRGYGLKQLAEGWDTYTQDWWNLPDWSYIDNKGFVVIDHMIKTNNDANKNAMYINFSSASNSGGRVYPYTAAAGTGSEVDDGANKGVNWWLIEHLIDPAEDKVWAERTGVVFMDFPGAGLIDSIIVRNMRNAPWSDGLSASLHEAYKNVSYMAAGPADSRHERFEQFYRSVTDKVNWVTGVIKMPYGFTVDSDGMPIYQEVNHDEYKVLVYPVDKSVTTTGITSDDVTVELGKAVGGVTGEPLDRANAVQKKLAAAKPGYKWSVIAKGEPGGLENWTITTPGAAKLGKVTSDGYIYLAWAINGNGRGEVEALDWNESDPNAGTPGERVAYFNSWSIYANKYFLKTLDQNGTAAKLTKVNYAFENIHPTDLTCFANNKSGSSNESDATGNDGASDAWADYQKGFTAEESVDGVADEWGNTLKGNFNQIKKLKAKHPHLKFLVSIGGWTYSKYFSDVAATDASRKKFVKSCVDMYINGNLPKLGDDPAGGDGVASGVFDGIDIDWEFPGSSEGHTGNHYSAADTANFTALLAEFRSQLGGKLLTAALPAGRNNIDKLDVSAVAGQLDLANLMTYDMHGGWEANGPTNSQAPIYDAAISPANGSGMTVDDAVSSYLAKGMPAGKIALGVPLYGRGWKGVPNGGKNGLYQSVSGLPDAYTYSQQPGVVFYKELVEAKKMVDGNVFWDRDSQSSWMFDGSVYFGIETPKSLSAKRLYIKNRGLAGVMMYSLEGDDPSLTLIKAATNR